MSEPLEPSDKPAGPRVERINFRVVGADGDSVEERELADLRKRVEMLRKAGQRLFDEADRLELHLQRLTREPLVRNENKSRKPA